MQILDKKDMRYFYGILSSSEVEALTGEDFINVFCYVDSKDVPKPLVMLLINTLGSEESPNRKPKSLRKGERLAEDILRVIGEDRYLTILDEYIFIAVREIKSKFIEGEFADKYHVSTWLQKFECMLGMSKRLLDGKVPKKSKVLLDDLYKFMDM